MLPYIKGVSTDGVAEVVLLGATGHAWSSNLDHLIIFESIENAQNENEK